MNMGLLKALPVGMLAALLLALGCGQGAHRQQQDVRGGSRMRGRRVRHAAGNGQASWHRARWYAV